MRKTFTHRGTGLKIQLGKSMANTDIFFLTLSGNSSAAMNDTDANRMRFAAWLRKVADDITVRTERF